MLPLTAPSPRILLVAFSLLAAMLASTVTGPTDAAAAAGSGGWTNTNDRSAVITAYEAEFSGSDPASGWTGNRASCSAGTTSGTYRAAIFDRVNWFRGMAGVPTGITENASYSAGAQEAALMMSESGKLSHYPDSSFSCYTNDGATAASSSDLYLGRTGPDAITGYMYDPGANNTSVGHRNWILHPTARQFGTGDIPSSGGWASNVLWVFDNVFGAQPALRESSGFVAWPPRGYVPAEVVYPRWSFSVRDANFNSASVTMQRIKSTGGLESVSAPVVHRSSSSGAPFSIMVWEPTGIDTSPPVDTTYRVTVSGVTLHGANKSYSYDVILIGDRPAQKFDYSRYVDQAYRDFLGRAATAAEKSSWSDKLNSGTSRYSFVLSLAGSTEWTAFVIDQMYLNTLGRPADDAGRSFWISKLQSGMSVAQVASLFYGSAEYVAKEGNSHERWITDLYEELLYRGPDSGGLSYWMSQVQATSTGSVALRFYQSEESRRTRVAELYERLLGRGPDSAGHAYWASVLLGGDDISLAASLASSDEYVASS